MSLKSTSQLSLSHAQRDFANSTSIVASSHLSASSHPLPQISKNRSGTKIILPLLKRTWKHDSVPNSSSIKRLRLVVKAESDHRESGVDDNKRRPHARIRIRKSLIDSIKLENDSFIKIGTKETAHLMVKWALQNTPYLVANFEIRASKFLLFLF
jgi:hypothetical protein